MSYETFCEYLSVLGIHKEKIERHTSLSIKNHLPLYEDPGGRTLYPLSEDTLLSEDLFNEATLITFSEVEVSS